MMFTTSWSVKTSQTPSQHRTMNWSLCFSNVNDVISGSEVTNGWQALSPNERETARSPHVLPFVTNPPFASIRATSVGVVAFLSKLSGYAFPFLHSTARLSPLLAI